MISAARPVRPAVRRSGERRKAIKCKDKEHARYRNAVRVFLRDVERWLKRRPDFRVRKHLAPVIRAGCAAVFRRKVQKCTFLFSLSCEVV